VIGQTFNITVTVGNAGGPDGRISIRSGARSSDDFSGREQFLGRSAGILHRGRARWRIPRQPMTAAYLMAEWRARLDRPDTR
jgi:hypothetical protein